MKRVLTLLVAAVCSIGLSAQKPSFRHITSREGLPYSWITDIFKDSEGFMWFSSIYGAYRFDGRFFEEYSFSDSPDGAKISVLCVRESGDGVLWFATLKGLYRLDRETDRKTCVDVPGGSVHGLAPDQDGLIWAGTREGLFRIDGESNVIPVPVRGEDTAIPVNQVYIDSRNTVWVGTTTGRLYQYDRQKEELAEVGLPERFGASVYCIREDASHYLWISTSGGGVFRYSPQSGAVVHYCVANGGLLNDLSRQIACSPDGTVWIATEKGLARMGEDGEMEFILNDSSSPRSLNDNATYAAFCDEDGNLWIGTFFGGVNIFQARQPLFESCLSSLEAYSADSKVVSSIIPSQDGIIVGTENCGVFRLSGSGEQLSRFHTGNSSIAGDNVHALCLDEGSGLWVATYYNGLSRMRPGGSSFTNFSRGCGRAAELSTNNIYSLLKDSRGNLWIGTQYGGLYRYDYTAGRIIPFPEGLPRNLFIWDIHESRDGNIWLAAFGGGLWRLSVADGYRAEKIQTPVNALVHICELRDGRFLLGTEKEGMLVFNPVTLESDTVTKEDGLPDDTIYGILQDDGGDVWMSSNSGLIRSDASLDSFQNYTMFDGLPTNRFNYNACRKIGSDLYFGSTNGLVVVHPEAAVSKAPAGDIRFNRLYINNELVPVGSRDLPLRLDPSRRLVLGPRQNTFGIDFSDNEYSSTGHKFAYQMHGLNSSWHLIGQRRHLDFLSLRPGSYTLKVAPMEDGQVDVSRCASLQIRVKPLWWQSVAARISFILILLLLACYVVYVFFQISSHRHALEMEKLEREKDNEINETKLRFFVNISHEFKTPLSLILGPVEQFMAGNVRKEQRQRYFSIIKKNADKLLSLINELLAFRETQFAKLNPSHINVSSALNSSLGRYDWLLEGKKIHTSVSCDPDLEMDADDNKLEKILGNLISNAYKHTREGGHIALAATLSGEMVRFEVKDDGEGISPEDLPHIFDRFFSSESYDKYSSGVGLSYVKSLVELHGGSISAQSPEGRGACFTILLPLVQKEMAQSRPDPREEYKSSVPMPVPDSADEFDDKTYAAIAAETSLLIVEDDATMRELLTDFFSGRYILQAVQTGEEAVKFIRQNRVDVIVSDVMLSGGMSGFEFCKFVKNDMDTSHIKVILMTVLSEPNYQMEGFRAGADAYILKPFKFSLLEQRLRTLLVNSYRMKEAMKIDVGVDGIQIPDSNTDELLMRKIADFVIAHISDSDLKVDSICEVVGMSKSSLYRKMKSITGQSAGEFVQNIRLKYGAKLLSETSRNISEVAYESGFTDPYYFSRAFKKQFGVSPRQWRVQNQSK